MIHKIKEAIAHWRLVNSNGAPASFAEYLQRRENERLEAEKQDPRFRVLDRKEIRDVVARWTNYGAISNILQRENTSESYAWGYPGTGPHDFALNILIHFSGGDFRFARKHQTPFVRDVIWPLPHNEPVHIPASVILGWIEKKRDADLGASPRHLRLVPKT